MGNRIFSLIVLLVFTAGFSVFVTALFFKFKRRRKVAMLNRAPRLVIDDVLAEPITEYVEELFKECVRARVSLITLPSHAAVLANNEINTYWTTSIEKLAEINPAAVKEVLSRNKWPRDSPYQQLDPPGTPAESVGMSQ
jgi:hypothetical protein